MTSIFKEILARNMRCPQNNLAGSLISRFVFDKRNVYLEQNAARLCHIQPHHNVLEVGFGSGHGLIEARTYIKEGPGVIHGIEISELMLNKARHRMKSDIKSGKIKLCYSSVEQLPYNTDMFDAVFHSNSFYFWPDMEVAVRELHRVMKPGATMVATMNMERIQVLKEKGLMKYGKPDPVRFMWWLEKVGFRPEVQYLSDGGKEFQAIVATVTEKQAHEEDFEEENVVYSDLHYEGGKPCYKVTEHGPPSVS